MKDFRLLGWFIDPNTNIPNSKFTDGFMLLFIARAEKYFCDCNIYANVLSILNYIRLK